MSNTYKDDESENLLDEVNALKVQLAALYYYVFRQKHFFSSDDNVQSLTKFSNDIMAEFGKFAESVNKDQQAENQLNLHEET